MRSSAAPRLRWARAYPGSRAIAVSKNAIARSSDSCVSARRLSEALRERLVRLEAVRLAGRARRRRRDLAAQRAGQVADDAVLQGEDVVEPPVRLRVVDDAARRGLGDARGHPHARPYGLVRPAHDVACARLAARARGEGDVVGVGRSADRPHRLEETLPREDRDPRHLGETGGERLGETGAEPLGLRTPGQVREAEHGDHGAGGGRRRRLAGGDPVDLGKYGAHVGRTAAGVLLEHPRGEAGEPLGERPLQGQWRRGLAQDRVDELDARVASERPAAAQHLVEHDAEREDVAAGVDPPAAGLLGRHVGERPHDLALDGAVAPAPRGRLVGLAREEAGEAEVEHLHVPALVHHHVPGLHVAVDDAVVVGVGESLGHLLHDRERGRGGERALARGSRRASVRGRAPSPRSSSLRPSTSAEPTS